MGQPTSERAVSFSTEELRVWEVFICLLDELKGEAFTFLAWRASDCQRAPALTEGQPNARSDLFPSYFFFGGWISEETMKLWGSGPHWQFFLISVVQPHRHQEELPSCLDGEWEPISYKHPSPGSCGKGHDFTDHNSKPLSLSLHRPCPILEKPSSKPSN